MNQTDTETIEDTELDTLEEVDELEAELEAQPAKASAPKPEIIAWLEQRTSQLRERITAFHHENQPQTA